MINPPTPALSQRLACTFSSSICCLQAYSVLQLLDKILISMVELALKHSHGMC
jgi:hypothetical protein